MFSKWKPYPYSTDIGVEKTTLFLVKHARFHSKKDPYFATTLTYILTINYLFIDSKGKVCMKQERHRSKKGVLGTGQSKKKGGGSLLRHIHVLDIYVSAPPPREWYCYRGGGGGRVVLPSDIPPRRSSRMFVRIVFIYFCFWVKIKFVFLFWLDYVSCPKKNWT